jgi:hypothetical protein
MPVHTVISGLLLQSATAKADASGLFGRGSNGQWYVQAANHGGESALWKLQVSYDNATWATLETYTARNSATVAIYTGVNAPYIRAYLATGYSGSNHTGLITVYAEAGIV